MLHPSNTVACISPSTSTQAHLERVQASNNRLFKQILMKDRLIVCHGGFRC